MNVLKCLIGVAVLLVAVAFVMPCEAQVVVRQPLFRPNAVVVRNVQPQRLVAPQRVVVRHQQQFAPQQFVLPHQQLVVPQQLVFPQQQFLLQSPQAIVVPGGGCNGGSQLLLRR